MGNHEVTTPQMLLKEDGSLREPGWSKRLVQQYERSMIKAPKFRIKEWDYYLVLNEDFAGLLLYQMMVILDCSQFLF